MPHYTRMRIVMMDKSDINTLQSVVIPNTYRNKSLLGINILENFMQLFG
jgi:hypothetical protein